MQLFVDISQASANKQVGFSETKAGKEVTWFYIKLVLITSLKSHVCFGYGWKLSLCLHSIL